MKRSPLVKKGTDGTVGHGRQIGYGDKIIHVFEEPTDSPQFPFVGDFLTWRGSERIYRRNNKGAWKAVGYKSPVYQDVIARLREEGIDVVDGDGS